jgi:hypothetical protein
MDNILVLMGTVLVVALAADRLYGASPSRQAAIKGAIKRTPRTTVGNLGVGTVRITGRVERRDPLLRSPLSQRPCLAFELDVEEQGAGRWKVRLRESRRFALADDTGLVSVEPGSHFELAMGGEITTPAFRVEQLDDKDLRLLRDRFERILPIVRAAGLEAEDWKDLARRFRYREALLEEGATVSVRGHAVSEPRPDGERSGPRSPPLALVLCGTGEEPVQISDDPGLL